MDLEIVKNGTTYTLSQFGLWVQDVVDTSPSIEHNFRRVWGKSARVNAGATYGEKSIEVYGKATVASIQAYEELKDNVNGLVVDINPLYIRKMLPDADGLYDFEVPGETTGALDLIGVPHSPYKYRWEVITAGKVAWSFIGRYNNALVFEFRIPFITNKLPFGETVPVDKVVSGSIDYKGNTENSQLEDNWAVELTANTGQPGTFDLKIGNKTFTHTSATPIIAGDKIVITGIGAYFNDTNVTHKTNYGHFVLKPGLNLITTGFKGTIKIIDYKELYK